MLWSILIKSIDDPVFLNLWQLFFRLDRRSSVQFSCSVVSEYLWPHGLQHVRPPYPSPTPGVYSNTCTLSRWYYPTISSSVIPFSSCLQSFPASGPFPMSQLFASDGQSTGVSASSSVLPVNIHWSWEAAEIVRWESSEAQKWIQSRIKV